MLILIILAPAGAFHKRDIFVFEHNSMTRSYLEKQQMPEWNINNFTFWGLKLWHARSLANKRNGAESEGVYTLGKIRE